MGRVARGRERGREAVGQRQRGRGRGVEDRVIGSWAEAASEAEG